MTRTEHRHNTIFRFAALALLAAFCLSVAFVFRHVDHACTGEDCPVCAVIHAARANFHSASISGGSFVSIPQVHSPLLPVAAALLIILPATTPVTEKRKLNN